MADPIRVGQIVSFEDVGSGRGRIVLDDGGIVTVPVQPGSMVLLARLSGLSEAEVDSIVREALRTGKPAVFPARQEDSMTTRSETRLTETFKAAVEPEAVPDADLTPIQRMYASASQQGVLALILMNVYRRGAGLREQEWIETSRDEQNVWWQAAGAFLPKILEPAPTPT